MVDRRETLKYMNLAALFPEFESVSSLACNLIVLFRGIDLGVSLSCVLSKFLLTACPRSSGLYLVKEANLELYMSSLARSILCQGEKPWSIQIACHCLLHVSRTCHRPFSLYLVKERNFEV